MSRNSRLWQRWVIYPVKPFLILFNWGMPDVAGNKMSLCSCHKLQKNALFAFKKVNIAPFSRESLIVFLEISDTSRGPTPGAVRFDPLSFNPLS